MHKGVANVTKPPLCAACEFSITRKRSWRTKGFVSNNIDKGNDRQLDSASCDHIISKQSGLVPQVTRNLTNRRCYEATTFLSLLSTSSELAYLKVRLTLKLCLGRKSMSVSSNNISTQLTRFALITVYLIPSISNVVVTKSIKYYHIVVMLSSS